MEDLEKMILQKKDNAFGGFMNYMEDKYANPKTKKRKSPSGNGTSEPPAGVKKRKLN